MSAEEVRPVSGNSPAEVDTPEANPGLAERIRRLVTEQPYGVLCTQGQGQPYGSLLAFAFSADLSAAVFATPVATRKYRLLSECDHVALVMDNRPDHPDDMMKVEALTATGRATEIERGAEFEEYSRLLIDRHPQLESFVRASSCALFRIDILRFFHVTRFQEVGQWVPTSP
ncbi:MAG: pyridoxamine 5'-phosphate oxidase family protein [Gemmatimonadales bacterium]|jgi:nitroimidazol reductase NimA-like FMN-containing flavoprotein (pyridoxamine 5'-phosphate oxidase superfamily)